MSLCCHFENHRIYFSKLNLSSPFWSKQR